MIDTDKYEGHDLARGRVGSDYNIYDRKGNIIFDADDVGSNMATLNLLADAPLLLAEVKRLRMIVAKLEDARIESASMYDRPKLFDAVREIYEQRLQDIYQEKREEE